MTERDITRPRRLGPWLLGGVALLTVVLGLIGMIVTDPRDNLTLVAFEFDAAVSGQRRLVGTVRNNTRRPYSRVRAEITLLDRSGRVVERREIVTPWIGGRQRWDFQVPVRDERAVRAVLRARSGRSYAFEGEAVRR